MSALAFHTDTRAIARALEDRETARVGKLPIARQAVARRVGCTPGTLETLRKGRLKRVERWLHEKLEALLVGEIESEIRRLTLELETYRRTRGDADCAPEMARLVHAIESAQKLISGEIA
jgi:hypothetical protein